MTNKDNMKKYVAENYWENRLKSNFDLTGVGNIGFSRNYNNFLYRLQIDILKKTLKKYDVCIKGMKVLDVGCGTGFFSKFYLEKSASIIGLDISSTSVKSLQKSLPNGKFIPLDITSEISSNPNLNDKSFDIINVFGVMYHIIENKKFEVALGNLSRYLKAGGYILISDYFGNRDVSTANHVKFRSIERYKMLEQTGIKILEIAPIYHLMNKRLKIVPIKLTNCVAPFLFFFDYIMNNVGLFKGNDIKLLIGKKS